MAIWGYFLHRILSAHGRWMVQERVSNANPEEEKTYMCQRWSYENIITQVMNLK